MRVFHTWTGLGPSERGAAAAIGNFDGVHLGHLALVRRVSQVARAEGLESVVVTFRQHPKDVLSPGREVAFLTDLSQRRPTMAMASFPIREKGVRVRVRHGIGDWVTRSPVPPTTLTCSGTGTPCSCSARIAPAAR